MRAVRSAVAVLGVLAVLQVRGAAHDPVTTTVTFDREVRAILQARCTSCHAPGRPAPMPLTTYDEVRPWARAIKDQILTRRMPKWSAAHGYGAFVNDPSLAPEEMAIVAAWVDGGLPRGSTGSRTSEDRSPVTPGFRRISTPLLIPASAPEATASVSAHWIGGWAFEPGDPLMTSATFTSADGTPIGTWVAGDMPVQLPVSMSLRVVPPVRVRLQRRTRADYEQPVAPRPSTLHLILRTAAPTRRVWVEQTPCGTPRAGREADLLAVRPLLDDRGSVRLWLERPGAPQVVVGWFRDADALYPRTFWLARPPELPPESRISSDGSCRVELTLAAHRYKPPKR